VLLVGNIDWGGVFAQFVGTMELLDPEERQLVRGFLINKFRGDRALLEPGIRWLERRCGVPVVGTLPFLHDVELLEEDSVADHKRGAPDAGRPIRIDVVHLPRISNATDFAPLEREPDVQVRYVERPEADEALPDCLILPGSKSTMADLAFVRQQGWDRYLRRCVDAQREVVGICGGFQMLGRAILDPHQAEGRADGMPGLGWLPMRTVFEAEKVVTRVEGLHLESRLPVAGYEIHMGRLHEESAQRPAFHVTKRSGRAVEDHDGMQSSDGRLWGTYLHGLFDTAAFRRWWVNRLRGRRGLPAVPDGPASPSGDPYDRLAQALRPHLDLDALYRILDA